MKCIYGPSGLDGAADMSELSVHFAAYDREELSMSFSTHDLQVAVDMTDVIPRIKTVDNSADYYRTATVRLVENRNLSSLRQNRCVAFVLTFWLNKYSMVTGLTYLPAATIWWKDKSRNTAQNILAATDAIYRIILLLLFAGVDIKLADLLGVSIYADSDFFFGGDRKNGSDNNSGYRPWFLEDFTEDI